MANAKQQRSGQRGEGEGGGWSFFTLPAVKVGNPASSASTTPAAAAAAATAASVEGALAGWMIMSAPSAKKNAASVATTTAPGPRFSSSKAPTRGGVKDTQKTTPTALLAFASAIKSKDWTTSSPVVAASTARHREAKTKVASPQQAPLTNRDSKARADARPTSSPPAKLSTASSKPPKSSGQPSSWARRAKSPQGQGGGQGRAPSSETRPAWAGAGRGKVAAFLSSVAGGVAATGWFLFRTSGQPSHAKQPKWSNPFGDSNDNAPANTRHPSWSTPSGNNNHGSHDQADGGGRGNARVEEENAQQGGAASADTGGVGNGDGEREAGVWVGWGGGCAF